MEQVVEERKTINLCANETLLNKLCTLKLKKTREEK